MRRGSFGVLGFAILASLSAFVLAARTDISGEWEIVVETPHGEMTSTVKFAQEGEIIRVSMAGPRGGATTGEGTIKGDDIRWSIVRSTAGGKRTVIYTGTVEGATMTGQAQVGDRSSVPWKAAKK